MNNRYANHPNDSKNYDTNQLREHYMVEEIFIDDKIELTYSHVDRIIFGGIKPVNESLKLEAGKSMGVDYFLERREMGVINVGGEGTVSIDGEEFRLNNKDGLYIGKGNRDIIFKSLNQENPAKIAEIIDRKMIEFLLFICSFLCFRWKKFFWDDDCVSIVS